jgi:P27 family predicted phage terminase small subunit|tara:strand:- start:197 stop:718 length:522 start_codon:yes stop_codon:yes gene_type:complete
MVKGRLPKEKNKLAGHRDNSLSVLQGGKTFETPKANKKWLQKTRSYWLQYWESELSSMAQKVDFPAFYRLFQYYDQNERAQNTLRKLGNNGLLSLGSTGQSTINPLITLTLKLEEKILRLEQELGLTPLSRQRLGISYSENAMGFQQLQQLLQEDEEKEFIDPRLKMIEQEEE